MSEQSTNKRKRLVSLVVPVLDEEDGIELFYETARREILGIENYDFEIVFVDDGSTDRTLEIIRELHKKDPRVRGIELSRNHGKELALACGLREARGDAAIPMDVDLQDPPSLIREFLAKWEEGYDTVIGVRRRRETDTPFKRVTARLFYRFYNRICGKHVVDNAGDFRLLDRKCIDALNSMPDRIRFTKGMYGWIGFKQATVDYERPARARGSSKWNAWKLWNFALDGITSFSSLPLRVWSYLGGFIAFIGFAYAIVTIFKTLLWGVDVPGYASLMVVVLCLGGLILLSLGIIGEYLGRIFEEAKGRPLYFIRSRVGFDAESDDKPTKAE